MKILSVEAFVVSQKLDAPFSFSQWSYDRRSVCLTRIEAEDGTAGWGEGYGPASVVKSGVEMLAPLIIGMNAMEIGRIWQHMYLKTLDFSRSGVLLASISSIDIALWDLKGKLLEQPIHSLLGGKRRKRIQVYATGMYFTEGGNLERKLADEAKSYVDQGFELLKMKVGHSLDQDRRNVESVRAAIGDEIKLMVDANHAYNFKEARELGSVLEDQNIGWFEEPLSPEDYEGYRRLRESLKVPIAAGECEYLIYGFKRLFEGKCVDIAQPDACGTGGLTEMLRIAALARSFHLELAPHCWGTGIAFAAGLHFLSTLDSLPGRIFNREPIFEMDRTENPLRDELTQPAFKAASGSVQLSDRPGLGVDVDLSLLQAYSEPV